MKKITAVILSLIIILSLSACNSGKQPAADTVSYDNICTVSIDCTDIKNNMELLPEEKASFVPESGFILKKKEAGFNEGETAFEVLKRVCSENTCTDGCQFCKNGGIQLESSYTAAYDSYYINGIHQLYAGDCGAMSGWLFNVNGEMLMTPMNQYELKAGDSIEIYYVCNMEF